MADISKLKLPNGSEYNLKDVNGRKEAYLTWGGQHFSASYGPIDAAMIGALGANRFAFLKAAGLTMEYSTNGGETWTDYGSTDTQKTGLFGNGQGFYLGKHTAAGSSTLGDMLRVTIATGAAGIYTTLNKIAIYMSTSGNTVQVKMEKALESTPNSYSTHLDWTGISGWSGWNILNISGITTYGNSSSAQYGRIRFIFKQTAITTTYSAASISIIMGFGGVGWTTPSNMARTGHLYAYDNAQNATFPAQVTATQFNGTATNASKVNNHTVNSDVPANAKFTDTVTTVSTTGSGNAITAISASDGAITATKGTTFLTSHQDISGKAPNNHASTATTYGIGTDTKYGHVKLSDSTTETTAAASGGTAATPKAVNDALDAAKTYADDILTDIEISGRNLLKQSNALITNSNYLVATYYFGESAPKEGQLVTFQIKGRLADTKTEWGIYNSGGTVKPFSITKSEYNAETEIYKHTGEWVIGSSDNTFVNIYAMTSSQSGESSISWVKLERHGVATDWSPAPEDLTTTTSLNELLSLINDQTIAINTLDNTISTVQNYTDSLQGNDGIINQIITQLNQNTINLNTLLASLNTINNINNSFVFNNDNLEIDGINSRIYSKQGSNYYRFIDRIDETTLVDINEDGVTNLRTNSIDQVGIGSGTTTQYVEQWSLRKGDATNDKYDLQIVWVGGD